MIWLIVAAFIFFILSWILFAPMVFYVNTTKAQMGLRWKGMGWLRLIYRNEEWMLSWRIFFFKREIALQKVLWSRPKSKKAKKERSRSRRKLKMEKMVAIARTFKVPICRMALDTGNYIWNAWLFPLNYLPGRQQVEINFRGKNFLVLELRNNAWRILWAWLK